MAVSEAKKRANRKWNEANYKRINLAVPIAEYEVIDKHCEEKGVSKNKFIMDIIREKLGLENK